MRARAKIVNPRTLSKIASSVEKISKTCVFKLSPTQVQFIVKDPTDGTQVWCQAPANGVFEDYVVEAQFRNEVYLEVQLAYLSRAFKSMLTAHSASFRLTRAPPSEGGAPMLAVQIESESKAGRPMSIVQNVPVTPLKRQQALELREPRIPNPDIYIILPRPLTVLKTVAERFRAMSTDVTLLANHAGSFVVQIDASAGMVETVFTGLMNPVLDGTEPQQPASQPAPEQFFDVTINSKDFLKFLSCHSANPAHVICCIHKDVCAVFYVYMYGSLSGDGNADTVLTYYIPAKSK
ncbi:Checkpoint protein hus1 [Blastocladiella emersonii ATCC 22665]|nr:Checkpoint protein hus1 [Blastocladiella emersonii ATCC 22665]